MTFFRQVKRGRKKKVHPLFQGRQDKVRCNLKDFIEYLVKNMVNHLDQVEVGVTEEEQKSLVEIRVDPEDVGKIVGKKGRVIHSLRTIAMSIGMRLGQKIRLEIIKE